MSVVALFTDFTRRGPYVGQMHMAIARVAPHLRVVDLLHDVPAGDTEAGAILLDAVAGSDRLPVGTVVVAVVDPGVGTDRRALALEVSGRWYVGPDNGLLALVAVPEAAYWFEVVWRPDRLSATFHGRDIFAPVGARLAQGDRRVLRALSGAECPPAATPVDRHRVVYLDGFGNAWTGLRACDLNANCSLAVGRNEPIPFARTFADRAPGLPFWFENSSGLVEIAVNRGSAGARFGISVGSAVRVIGCGGRDA